MMRLVDGSDHIVWFALLGRVGRANLGDSDGALSCYREAATRAEALAGADPKDVRARRVLASTYWSRGRMSLDADPRAALRYFVQF